ncbi:MAG: uroporphyrinogen-III synthase [Pseudomonadota bacterium]
MADKPSSPRLLLTRPAPGSERFLAALRARGLPMTGAVLSPAIEVVSIGAPIDIPADAAAVFTSRHAVARTRAETGTTAYCVGDATAHEAQRHGFAPISAGGSADDLLQMLLNERPTARLIYCHGAHIRRDIVAILQHAGLSVSANVVYDQPALNPTETARALLAGHEPIILPLFSTRTAEIVAGWVADASAPILPIALSDAVASAWKTAPKVAESPTLAAMVDAVAASCRS